MKTEKIDLCRVGLAERNTLVLRRFDAASGGDELAILTDAPPWVLYHQLSTDRFGEFEWNAEPGGEGRWSIRVLKRGRRK